MLRLVDLCLSSGLTKGHNKMNKKSAAFKSGYIAAEMGKSVNTNPYRGKPDSDDFRKGFYQWLKDRGLKMK
jgi:hypothetical protein